MAHPERYTERYMALEVIKPLLNVLVYLHGQRIVHRWAAACSAIGTPGPC